MYFISPWGSCSPPTLHTPPPTSQVLKVNTVFFCLCLLCFGFMLFVKWWDCFSLFGVPDLTEEYQLLFTDIREIVTLLLEGDDYEL